MNRQTIADIRNLLMDVEFMVADEVKYIKTGKHDGVPHGDALGQWQTLATEAKRLLARLDGGELERT